MTAAAHDLDRELDEMATAELARDGQPASEPVSAMSSLVAPAAFTDQDRNLAVLVHLGTLGAAIFSGGLLHVLVPLVAFLTGGERSAAFKSHVRGQLNFQITFVLAAILAVVGSVVTFGLGIFVAVPVLLFLFVTDIVCSIKAAMAASRGEDYTFPFTLNLVK